MQRCSLVRDAIYWVLINSFAHVSNSYI